MKKIFFGLIVAGSVALSGCGTQETVSTTSTTTQTATTQNNSNVKIINGKRYVYLEPHLGSNMPGRWVPEEQAAAQAGTSKVERADSSAVQSWQDRSSQGGLPGGN